MSFYFDTKEKKASIISSKDRKNQEQIKNNKFGLRGFILSLAAIIIPIVMIKIMPFLDLGERGGWIDVPSAEEIFVVLCALIIYLVLLIRSIRYSRRGLHDSRHRKFAIAGLIIGLGVPVALIVFGIFSIIIDYLKVR